MFVSLCADSLCFVVKLYSDGLCYLFQIEVNDHFIQRNNFVEIVAAIIGKMMTLLYSCTADYEFLLV